MVEMIDVTGKPVWEVNELINSASFNFSKVDYVMQKGKSYIRMRTIEEE